MFARFAGLLIAAGLSCVPVTAQSLIGYVVECHGVWVLNGSTALAPGQKLPAGGSIRRQSSSSADYITIADTQTKVLASASRNCGKGVCSGRIVLPRRTTPNSWWESATETGRVLFAAGMEKVFGSPLRDDLNQIRSGGLSDDVVKLVQGRIDMSSVLKTEGEQYLRWRVASLNGSAGWTKPVKLDTTAIVTGFQPGLFETNLMRRSGADFEPVASGWILVTPAADFEKTRALFKEMRTITEKWGDKVRPETARLFLWASLDNLARSRE